ncbi:MAG: ABC transporter ATP-binding protein/permease [Clostridiales bacterium]|jgi:ATP-binding cassette subfamily B protein|nr:ABC transporter ATP-binding protein/permease [Clostridiales bacterium]
MAENKNKELDSDRIKSDSLNGGDAFAEMVFQKPKSFKVGMGRLLKYLKPWRFILVVSILFAIGATVIQILGPSVIQKLTDSIFDMVKDFGILQSTPPELQSTDAKQIVADGLSKVAQYGAILIGFYTVTFICNYVQGFMMAGVAAKSTKKMRNEIATKINRVPLSYYDKVGFGDVLSRTTNDVSIIGQSLNEGMVPTIISFLLIIGLITAMLIVNWKMALITIATVPISFILIGLVMSKSQKYQKQQRDYLGQLNSQIEENYSAQSVVLAFRGQTKAQSMFDVTNRKLANSSKNAEFLTGLMWPLMAFVGNLGYIAVIVGGVLLLNNNSIASLGVITQFLVYSRLFMMPFGQLAQGLGLLQSGAAGSERVFEFLDEKEQPIDKDKVSLKNVKGDVKFENVRFGYDPEHAVIKDFSADIKSGQKVAIVGPTGAGKTTIINLMMRFYEPQQGLIKIDGVPISDMARADVRSMFGMVLQDTWLFEGTIKENLIYAKQGVTDEQVVECCKAANIHHFILTLEGGYDHKINDETNISVGQRQLITIARAMVQNSPILILDEATSNVDTRTEQHIQDAMDKVSKGRTSFVIAHRLSTIKNADLILVLKEGDIVESGNHEQLISKGGFYQELYNSQFADPNAE